MTAEYDGNGNSNNNFIDWMFIIFLILLFGFCTIIAILSS